jgi:hypothetical protein
MLQSLKIHEQNPQQPKNSRLILNWFFAVIAAFAACGSLLLAITSNYGGHHDIYLMLGSFLSVLQNGDYIPSRFTGYPVAEIGIGASAWAGGSALSNSVNFFMFLISVLLFPFCFSTKPTLTRYLAFAAMALSSTVLAFDNIISIDYPWSCFFWVIGCFCLKRLDVPHIATIPMALAIGSRPVFALFVITSIMLIDPLHTPLSSTSNDRIKGKVSTVLITLFAGSLFYIPVWFKYGFSLSWISAVSPDNQGFIGLAGRFAFKLITAAGVFQSAIIIGILAFAFLRMSKNKLNMAKLLKCDALFLTVICAINLTIFARMPVQLSYLQPLLLCMYYLISRLDGNVYAGASALIAGINMVNWVVQPRLLRIQYQSQELCSTTVAESAKPELWLDKGRIREFKDQSKKAECYRNWFGQIKGANYSNAIMEGKPLGSVDRKAIKK